MRAAIGQTASAGTIATREVGRLDPVEIDFDPKAIDKDSRLAIMIGPIDVTDLSEIVGTKLTYRPTIEPLQLGENRVVVYKVSMANEWEPISEVTLKVVDRSRPADMGSGIEPASDKGSSSTKRKASATKVEFTPNVSLNLKGQNQNLTFPRESRPDRNPFTDLAGQSSIQLKVTRGGWALQNQINFAGSTFQNEALRFGELGNRAPKIDLSSYHVEIGKGRFKVNLGHVSFGSNRHLINSFSSRGVTVTVPITKSDEVSFMAMNGSSIVGFGNLLGVNRFEHSVTAARYAREFIRKRPNGLRLEVSLLRGSLLPITSVNQRSVNDAERSIGIGLRVNGSTADNRFRYELGLNRSRFFNPVDPLLEQGQNVRPIDPRWRTARHAEISYDVIQALELWRGKKLKLTGTYRHEEIQPLYRSIAVSTQADRRQNQFEVTASLGEINFVYGNLGDRDNLNNINSILKTLNRRNNMSLSIGLGTFFDAKKPRRWLPQLSYTLDHLHQFGAFLPTNGDFRDLSQVPDQKNLVQGVNAQWQFTDKFSVGYRQSRAFQDNRQQGRERADFLSSSNTIAVGTKPHTTIDLDIELAREAQSNLEQPRIDRTFRLGTRLAWRPWFLKRSAFAGGLSGTIAGDGANTTDARNAELDLQWSYRMAFGKEKFKKADAQFFIRYSNRYGKTIDRTSVINNFVKTQVFNFGLTLNVL